VSVEGSGEKEVDWNKSWEEEKGDDDEQYWIGWWGEEWSSW
jgi:hypothetical protein